MTPRPTLVVGASGHARVVLDILLLLANEFIPVGLTDRDSMQHGRNLFGVPVLGDDSIWSTVLSDGTTSAIVAIGDNRARARLADALCAAGFTLVTAVHPSAVIGRNVVIEGGSVVMAGAVINPGVRVGGNAIVNTGASIDHDCHIGAAVHVAPGAHLGGGVMVGPGAFIGLGSSIKPGVTIGADAIVGVGASVIRDVASGTTVVGVPARPLQR